MAKLNKRLFTHKQIEDEAVKLGRDYPSLFTLTFVVYYKNGTSPVKTAKTTSANTYNTTLYKKELGDGRYALDNNGKYVIATPLVFGEFIEIFLDDKIDFQKESQVRSLTYHNFIDWVWFGEPDGKGNFKPFTDKQKSQVLKEFHKYANSRGNSEIEFIDYNLRKRKLI